MSRGKPFGFTPCVVPLVTSLNPTIYVNILVYYPTYLNIFLNIKVTNSGMSYDFLYLFLPNGIFSLVSLSIINNLMLYGRGVALEIKINH
jgi:hypothetical protein